MGLNLGAVLSICCCCRLRPSLPSTQESDSIGFFNGASNFVLNQSVTNYNNETKDKVLQWLAKFTMSGAEFDARGHVPGCHPGTRITILETLQRQVGGLQHGYQMVWLRGPAGVGKSAILQSLAERLSETSSLGATLFFSRPNWRHDPDFVIPTIAYQLAVRIPSYKGYVERIMVSNPKLLEKDVEHQFQVLIVEPFTRLELTAGGGRWVILLDGLDECQGEDAQILFVNLISRFTRQHPTVPLVWVIASRPEAHLQGVFNSKEVRGSFEEHEVLANSDDACRDVEGFLRAKFVEIRQRYEELIPAGAPWPAEQDITRVSKASSGFFALATTIVYYVGDPDASDPISQLATVLSVTEGLEPGSLSALYTLYSTILASVPKAMLPVLKLVLAFYITQRGNLTGDDDVLFDAFPLVLFATIFGLQQHTVYGALRKLHSVIQVPLLRESGYLGIRFYHASFLDYLKTLEDYVIDVGMMKTFWWGWFAVLHGGDSTAYHNAISGGRPPVPLSWDVELADHVLEYLWLDGIRNLLHSLLPPCPVPAARCALGHCYLFLDAKELPNALEKFDFSALIVEQRGRAVVLHDIYGLFKWLASTVPPELSQSDVVKKIPMRDLDLARVPKAKFSLEATWSCGRGGVEALGSRTIYNTQHPRQNWKDKVFPIEDLISKLDKLRSENSMLDVLVVGERPSGRCVLIRTEFTGKEEGIFYYVPYCG